MKKLFLYCCIMAGISNVYAVTNSSESIVKQITIGDTYARVKLTSMTSMEGCARQDFYYLDLSNGKNAGTLSVILTAKVTQSLIVVQAGGCVADYPLITHIYLRNL